MRPKNNEQIYNLIHSQEMVRFMWKYSLHMQSTQIPCSIAFEEELDFNILACAVNEEIKRNDCMRLRIFKDKFRIKQYFVDEYKLEKILYKEFSSEEEQTKYFDEQSGKSLDVFGGELFRIIFFKAYDGKHGVFIIASHMIMDFLAVFIFFKDLMAVYDSLKNKLPMPRPLAKYEDIISKEQDDPKLEERIEKDTQTVKEWLKMDRRPTYNDINGTAILDRQSKLLLQKNLNMPHVYNPLRDASSLVKCHLSAEDSRLINNFITENGFSAEWVIQVGLRLYLSKLNRKVNDSVFWVLCPRRKTVKEKRCGGTLASPLPWREIFSNDQTFMDAVLQLSRTQAFLFRHSDVPFTAVRQMEIDNFRLAPIQSANSMMFSYLPGSKTEFGDRVYQFSAYNFGYYVMPIYGIATYDPFKETYTFSYIHRLNLSTDDDVRRFNDGVVRTILTCVKDPQKTIGQVLEEI